MLVSLLLCSANAAAAKKYNSSIDYSADWRKISGPGLDPQCSGNCSTGTMIQTVECGSSGGRPIITGLLDIRYASAVFCSGRAVEARDEAIVEQNADNIAACFRRYPNKDRYEIFIHEMLCQWMICKKNLQPNPPINQKLGIWKQESDGRIEIHMKNGTFNYVNNIFEFGAGLMSRGWSLCDVVRDAGGAPPPAPVALPGASRVVEPAPAVRRSGRTTN